MWNVEPKYTIALLGLPGLALMVIVPEWRKWLRHPSPYIAAFLALLVFSPVLYWNYFHEWASFVFQGPRRFNSTVTFSLHEYLLDMICLVTPSVFFAVVPAFLIYRKENTDRASRAKFSFYFPLFCSAGISFRILQSQTCSKT